VGFVESKHYWKGIDIPRFEGANGKGLPKKGKSLSKTNPLFRAGSKCVESAVKKKKRPKKRDDPGKLQGETHV